MAIVGGKYEPYRYDPYEYDPRRESMYGSYEEMLQRRYSNELTRAKKEMQHEYESKLRQMQGGWVSNQFTTATTNYTTSAVWTNASAGSIAPNYTPPPKTELALMNDEVNAYCKEGRRDRLASSGRDQGRGALAA